MPAALVPLLGAALVLARIVSGNGQTAHAFVAGASKTYVTRFPQRLVVAVNAPPMKGGTRRVRFRCIAPGCTFPPTDIEPNSVHRAGPSAWDVDIAKGSASVFIEARAPFIGAYRIEATPTTARGERSVPVYAVLTAR